MKHVYELGKIDYNHAGRRVNRVTLTFDDGADIRDPGDEYGMPTYRIGNATYTDCVSAGPCNFFGDENTPLDKFPEVADTAIYKLACYFADKYGLKYLKCYDALDRRIFDALCRGV